MYVCGLTLQECSERQVQVERALQEKKMVEKELERAVAQGPLEHTQAGESLYELQKRACMAERARDEATIKLENTVATLRRLEARSVYVCSLKFIWSAKKSSEGGQLTDFHQGEKFNITPQSLPWRIVSQHIMYHDIGTVTELYSEYVVTCRAVR